MAFPAWRSFPELPVSAPQWQDGLPYQVSYLEGLRPFVVSFGDHDLVFLYLSQSYESFVGHSLLNYNNHRQLDARACTTTSVHRIIHNTQVYDFKKFS
jgi:hypothetical protein